MRERFWEAPLESLDREEWEALCDRCGKCCLIKLEDEDTGQIVFTRLACKLFNNGACQCRDYAGRHKVVDDCVTLDLQSIPASEYWLPETCAYVRRYHGRALPDWHHLLSGSFEAMHAGGHSVLGRTESEERIQNYEDAVEFIDMELGQ